MEHVLKMLCSEKQALLSYVVVGGLSSLTDEFAAKSGFKFT